MPAYGKNLSSAETQALVAFLSTLDGGDAAGARFPGPWNEQPGRDRIADRRSPPRRSTGADAGADTACQVTGRDPRYRCPFADRSSTAS